MRPVSVQNITSFLKKVAYSYSLIYFTRKAWIGAGLMLLTFFDLGMGLAGLWSIAVCLFCTIFFNTERSKLSDGYYTYNALMVGIALGSFYDFNLPFFLVLTVSAILTFFITMWMAGLLYPKKLPFLSIPYLLVIWVFILGLTDFNAIKLTTKKVFSLVNVWPSLFSSVTAAIDHLVCRDIVHIYFRSLSAVIFQYNDLAGLFIGIILLLSSRIAFMLSIYGYLIGYLFYSYFGGDFTPLIYTYIGFNFILTAIAIGGFFIVPSVRSHLLLIFVIPVTILLVSALHKLLSLFALPMYTLPFNVTVLLTIRVLQMKKDGYGLQLVLFQQFSPEMNLYKSKVYDKRFKGKEYFHLCPPVIGEWYISQGYDGAITHKGEWRHALDFDIRNEDGKTYVEPGMNTRDFYCYQAPVVAPGDGEVVLIKDNVPDNAIKEVDLVNNWGNTIVIKHSEWLYTKLSHLKERSFKVKEGDTVRCGEVVALLGNSGRSPEPHLHFQVQTHPFIGSHTIEYPLAYYLTKTAERYSFHSFEVPKLGETVLNMVNSPIMVNALRFLPGQEINWQLSDGMKQWQNRWSVYDDASKRRYLLCHESGSVAYFECDSALVYFTDFYGSRRSFLYQFHIAFHKMPLGCYKGITLEDDIMPHSFFSRFMMGLQDVVAPFCLFLTAKYKLTGLHADDFKYPTVIDLETGSSGVLVGKKRRSMRSEMKISKSGIERVSIAQQGKTVIAVCGG